MAWSTCDVGRRVVKLSMLGVPGGKKPNLLLRCNYKRTQIANFSKLCRYMYVGLILLLHCVAFDNGHKRTDVYFAHKKDIRIIISIAIFRATRNYTYLYLSSTKEINVCILSTE